MKKRTRRFRIGFLAGCAVFLCASNSHGIIKLNYFQLAFMPDGRGELSDCIQKGAFKYLLSYSHMLRFFSQIEAGNGKVDVRILKSIVEKAVGAMKAANYYERLYRTALQKPYDPIMIDAAR